MKLYETKGFPNPLRVAIALAEKNATDQLEYQEVNVMAGQHRTESFLAKNPMGTVPVLELEDKTYIAETTAITEYIDHRFDGPSLTGKTPKERAVIHKMQRRAEMLVIDAVAAFFHHATDGLGPELETYQNKEWGMKQKTKAETGFYYFDHVLATSNFTCGEHFTMADITLFAGLAFADFAKIDVPSSLIHLHQWRDRVASRPSVISATQGA